MSITIGHKKESVQSFHSYEFTEKNKRKCLHLLKKLRGCRSLILQQIKYIAEIQRIPLGLTYIFHMELSKHFLRLQELLSC